MRLSQQGGPGLRIYILQEQSGPVIPPGTGFLFRRLLRLAGLRYRYSKPPPHGVLTCGTDQSHVTTDGQSVSHDVEPLLVLKTRCLLLLTITVVSLWSALSDERSGLWIVSQSLHF
jgi:hypothetical protein